jgi:hypothetical protein
MLVRVTSTMAMNLLNSQEQCPMEQCYGCGKEAERMPVIGVMNRADVEAGTRVVANPSELSAFVGVYACAECHRDPGHRTAHALKCHFFERKDERKVLVGLIQAGSMDLQHDS